MLHQAYRISSATQRHMNSSGMSLPFSLLQSEQTLLGLKDANFQLDSAQE